MVYGCVDGFIRIFVYLFCSINNKVFIVLGYFLDVVVEWGLFFYVRSDRGGENVDVIRYMIERRGIGRSLVFVGRSVYN